MQGYYRNQKLIAFGIQNAMFNNVLNLE